MATHSSILAWRIPWTEKPGRLQSMGSQRVIHDWVTNTHTKKTTQFFKCANDLNRHFYKEDVEMSNLISTLKRCSTLLVIRKMQISNIRYYFIHTMMAIAKKMDNYCQGCGESGNLMRMWECKRVLTPWTTVWVSPKTTELPFWPSNPTPIYKHKPYVYTITCVWMFTAALPMIVKKWKQHKCPSTNEWINKMLHIHIMEYYFATKRNEVLIHTIAWKLENTAKWKTPVTKDYILSDSIYMKNSG